LLPKLIMRWAAWLVILSCGCYGSAAAPTGDAAIGLRCTQVACGWAATFESQVLSLTIPGSRVEVCRNQECFGATFPSDRRWISFPDPSHDAPTIFASLTQDQRLMVGYYTSNMEKLQDGDVYDIRLTAADGSPGIDAHVIAIYSIWYPNGEGCAPACLRTDLSPSIP
jgi:hypothetical protein